MNSFKNLYTNFMQDIVGITKEPKHPLILRNEGLGGAFVIDNMKDSLIINTSYYPYPQAQPEL